MTLESDYHTIANIKIMKTESIEWDSIYSCIFLFFILTNVNIVYKNVNIFLSLACDCLNIKKI